MPSGRTASYGPGVDRAEITITSLREADHEVRWDLGGQAFGGTLAFDPDRPTVSADRAVAAYDGDRLAGTVVTLGFEMSWSGSSVGCGGVSGVVVRPEDRGRGIARAMLQETFRRMQERGEVIAALYPTTATLYRSMGFEICGSHVWRSVGLDLLPAGPASSLSWRRVDFGDPAVRTVYETMATRVDGWVLPGDSWWARTVHEQRSDKTKNRYAYVGARDGIDVATLYYRYDQSDVRLYDLGVDLIAGTDDDALAAALGFLAGNGTTAGHLVTTLPFQLLVPAVPNLQHSRVTSDWPWMLRLVDVPGAFRARRFPSSVSGRVDLDIADTTISANAGPHVLEFARGTASVEPGGSGAVSVRVGDLARIYAGNDVGLLARAGHLAGATADDVDLLRAACATHPTMPFFF